MSAEKYKVVRRLEEHKLVSADGEEPPKPQTVTPPVHQEKSSEKVFRG